jgi:hypothetical protein
MRSRAWALGGVVVVGVAVASAGVVSGSSADQPTATQDGPANTATVERGELSAMVSLDGILTYRARADDSPYSAVNRARGIYTDLPEPGERVDCGDVLYRVDDDPVLLLCGAIPAYRDLAIGDHGNDVRQLNRNLHVHEGREFSWRTEEALEELQGASGLTETGALDIGDAVFLPKAVRVAKVSAELGGSAQPGAQVVQATSDKLEVRVNLDASQQGAVRVSDRAQITLPGNRQATGKVERLGKVAQAPAGQDDTVGAATVTAYISLDKPRNPSGLDQAPVQVDIATKGVKDALSVPVLALVGKAGGGYAVEVVRDDGQLELVGVELGLFDTAAGRVEIEGDVREGDRVVVPSS